MKISLDTIVKGVFWTAGLFGLSQLLRLFSSIILTRLLAPELFGILVIVNALQIGVYMLSDLGFEQNLIVNSNADKPLFYNTLWTLRLVRGFLLSLCFLGAGLPLAHLYNAPLLAWILPIVGINFMIGGFCSLGPLFLQKRLRTAKLNIFQFATEAVATITQITYALLSPTVWALVVGGLTSNLANAIGSYFLVPELRHRFKISNVYASQIFSFGKWIFLSSTIYFLSNSFDNLYFGKAVPLELLGVYGIARNIPDAVSVMIGRVSAVVVLPFVATHSDLARQELREELKSIRVRFLLIAALGFAILIAGADLLIRFLYDPRYQDASWILSILLVGRWISMLCNINESVLIGFRKPLYGAAASAVKFACLFVGLPLTFIAFGFGGAVIFVAISEVLRYVPLLIGQRRERFSFVTQDFGTTFLMFGLVGLLECVRSVLGFGGGALGRLLTFT
jgi:O-antigen/teichoic acid export membrane protein